MKKLFIIANWKAHGSFSEGRKWVEEVQLEEGKEVIFCPPFPLLSSLHQILQKTNSTLSLGSQDVSSFPQGAFTAEVPATILSEYVAYCLIAHSERRKYFHETADTFEKKITLAQQAHIEPIFCIPSVDSPIPRGVHIVAYEPEGAIGTGNPDTPGNTEEVSCAIREKHQDIRYVLYGGSVTSENVRSFTEKEHIDGVLVGSASLDSHEFTSIVKKA